MCMCVHVHVCVFSIPPLRLQFSLSVHYRQVPVMYVDEVHKIVHDYTEHEPEIVVKAGKKVRHRPRPTAAAAAAAIPRSLREKLLSMYALGSV